MNEQARGRMTETIESIAELGRLAAAEISPHQRWIERMTRVLGRPRTVYVVAALVIVWIAVNLGLPATGRAAFDEPPFPWLQGLITLSGLFVAVLILTTANRIARIDLRRDRLDLQINLLTERKVAKLIDMVDAIRSDMPQIPTHHDPEVHELRESVNPKAVVEAIEEQTPAHADDLDS